jgi:hypothetical protein
MSGKYEQHLSEHRRLVILRVLSEAPAYSANASILQTTLDELGLTASRDQVVAEIAWLTEMGLITSDHALPGVVVAKITERGHDVAEGKARVPGVKRPGPR